MFCSVVPLVLPYYCHIPTYNYKREGKGISRGLTLSPGPLADASESAGWSVTGSSQRVALLGWHKLSMWGSGRASKLDMSGNNSLTRWRVTKPHQSIPKYLSSYSLSIPVCCHNTIACSCKAFKCKPLTPVAQLYQLKSLKGDQWSNINLHVELHWESCTFMGFRANCTA